MGKGVSLNHGYIEIDTDTWLEARTGARLGELTDMYRQFDLALHQESRQSLDAVPLFITARAGTEWHSADHAVIQTAGEGAYLSLSHNVIIHRYLDPVFGPVAFVTSTALHTMQQPVAYADTKATADATAEVTDWYSFDEVQIHCPNAHRWTYRNGDLIDPDGTYQNPRDVFPDGQIVTTDQDSDSDTYGEDRIVCPSCGSPCEVSLPGH